MVSEPSNVASTAQRSSADRVPLREIMSNDVICARETLHVGAVIRLMMQLHIGCLPVVDSRRHPIGVVTKFDLVEQLEAGMRGAQVGMPLPTDVRARTAEEVMMPIALTLSEDATVSHAAAMMMCEDTHHVLVISSTGALTGVVSTRDIVGWLVESDRSPACGSGTPHAFTGS
jgi:CBS-domain-containing membrane protein